MIATIVLLVRYEFKGSSMTIKKTNSAGQDSSRITFLDTFIIMRMKNYIPVERKHTSKEKFINFSPQKYYASLLLLKSGGYSLKEIASWAKISYELLRKWRSEKEFKKLTSLHLDEFMQSFITHLQSRVEEQLRIEREFFKKPFLDITKKQHPVLTLEEFRDIAVYDGKLCDRIYRWVIKTDHECGKLSNERSAILDELDRLEERPSLGRGNNDKIKCLLKRFDEAQGTINLLRVWILEGIRVTDLVYAVLEVPFKKRKHINVIEKRYTKVKSSKSTKDSSLDCSKTRLSGAIHLLTQCSTFTIKKKGNKNVLSRNIIDEDSIKRAAYLVSLVIRDMK